MKQEYFVEARCVIFRHDTVPRVDKTMARHGYLSGRPTFWRGWWKNLMLGARRVIAVFNSSVNSHPGTGTDDPCRGYDCNCAINLVIREDTSEFAFGVLLKARVFPKDAAVWSHAEEYLGHRIEISARHWHIACLNRHVSEPGGPEHCAQKPVVSKAERRVVSHRLKTGRPKWKKTQLIGFQRAPANESQPPSWFQDLPEIGKG
jgi:hypothetical protein